MDQSRPYQAESIEKIRNEFRLGNNKTLLWLATGGGKTWIFCKMVKDAVSRGKSALIVVRGRKLVDQASKRLFREQVPHGVYMAGHWNFRPNLSAQVCSIDTLIAREIGPDKLPADLIVIDEAHLASSPGYKKFLEQYPQAFIVAVTATPWVDKGLRHVADSVVHPITMQGLVDEGYLVGFKPYAPSVPDLSGVKVVMTSEGKDYNNNQLGEVMISGQLTGKVIDHWKSLAKNRPTICFAVNIKHSKFLAEKFVAAGVAAEHCDADTKDAERENVIRRLESGETKVVCNVGIFCTGVDIPRVGAIIMARPTKSRNLFIQQAGRGTRPIYANDFDLSTSVGRLDAIRASEKPDCILLDHAGNILQNELPTDEPEVDLDGNPKEKGVSKTKICDNCVAVYRGTKCPECGVDAPEAPDSDGPEIQETDDRLVEIDAAELRRLKELKKLFEKAPGAPKMHRGVSGRRF